MSVIRVEGLSKHFRVLNRRQGLLGSLRDLFSTDFKTVKAVDDISFEIAEGEIVGYIGPNGAGKSTTIKMMTGILKPSSGSVLVNGLAPYDHRRQNAQHMGAIFGQRTQLWWDLPVIESFKILKEIYRVDDQAYRRQMELFNSLVDLEPLYGKSVRSLSLGQRMLCDIVAAFIHNPRVVFLDEPTIGLDISIKSKIRAVIKELNATHKTTIILTTHDLSDIEALCQRIMIIDKGKLIYDGSIDEVTELFGVYRTLRLQIPELDKALEAQIGPRLDVAFGPDHGITLEQEEPGWLDITVNQEHVPLLDVLSALMRELPIKDIRILEISMENVVQKIYDGGLHAPVH